MKKGIQLMLSLPSLAIWLYLLHSILASMNADRLLWFLYWIYVPIGLVGIVIEKLMPNEKE